MITASILLAIATQAAAHASMGDAVDSVEKDRQYLRGNKKIQTRSLYEIHEITSDGITVREYVANNGVVFGIAWIGGGEPDLSQLFSKFYKEYRDSESSAQHPSRRAPRKIHSKNMIVEKFGHMGAVQGRAYVSKLIPSGVNESEIQ
jgi:hypothetical protein